MHQPIEIGKPFGLKVPNGLRQNIEITLSGIREPRLSIVKGEGIKAPDLIINPRSIDNVYSGSIVFHDGSPIGQRFELVAHENGALLDPNAPRAAQAVQTLRNQIEASQDDLYVEFNVSQALTFDSSAWLRSIGQIEITNQLERKLGNALHKNFGVFSGVGFGVIQALHFANGGDSSALFEWWLSTFKKSLKAPITSFATGDTRRSYKKAEKAIRKLFQDKGRDLLMKDLHSEVFIPLMDINGRALAIIKSKHGENEGLPFMPIYKIAAMGALDPIEFKTKAIIEGYTTLASASDKNPDTFLKVANPNLHITSIGSPVRVVNHGNKRVNREMLALIELDRHNAITLARQKKGGINRVRLECKPIDKFKRFDFSKQAIEAAINSAHEA